MIDLASCCMLYFLLGALHGVVCAYSRKLFVATWVMMALACVTNDILALSRGMDIIWGWTWYETIALAVSTIIGFLVGEGMYEFGGDN